MSDALAAAPDAPGGPATAGGAELIGLGAADAAARIARGELTAEALAQACLAQIDAYEPSVAAWAHLDPERVLAQARACDARPTQGALHGVPVAFKDIIETADMPCAYGSRAYAGHRPHRDAACVAAARAAGAIVMGKTVTTEFAGRDPGPTANPHHRGHSPGGSSSGSAAAVAARMVPLALGSQTAGSTIRPAAYCGVYGYKPTFGWLDLSGVHPLAATFDTLGLMARSVADLRLLRDALMDPQRAAGPSDPLGTAPRIGLCRTGLWAQAQPAAQASLEAVAGRLAAAGAEVRELTLPAALDDLREPMWGIVQYEMARALLADLRATPAALRVGTRHMCAVGLAMPRAEYIGHRVALETLGPCMHGALDDVDVVLTPSAVGEAPATLADTGPVTFNYLWHAFGMPALTLPVGRGPGGLPLGVQLVTRRHADDALLDAAAWAEAALGLVALTAL